jgi:hypothetical protein
VQRRQKMSPGYGEMGFGWCLRWLQQEQEQEQEQQQQHGRWD